MRLFTLTWTGFDAVAPPDPSMARTTSAWAPFAAEKLSQVAVKGAWETCAMVTLSTWNSTCAVPAGTVAESDTCPATTEPALKPSRAGAFAAGGGVGVGVGAGAPVGDGLLLSGVDEEPPEQARTVAIA